MLRPTTGVHLDHCHDELRDPRSDYVRQDAESRNKKGSGQPSSSTTEITIARIGEMIPNDERVTLREISSELRLSYGSLQHIVPDAL
ncbi:hypothetical protein TNCV_353301 [Trichonephila clavipes]|nr:hypothetical protein TNCV_353301 [Trichonephila clavipes]